MLHMKLITRLWCQQQLITWGDMRDTVHSVHHCNSAHQLQHGPTISHAPGIISVDMLLRLDIPSYNYKSFCTCRHALENSNTGYVCETCTCNVSSWSFVHLSDVWREACKHPDAIYKYGFFDPVVLPHFLLLLYWRNTLMQSINGAS